jgi:hypothetical protein
MPATQVADAPSAREARVTATTEREHVPRRPDNMLPSARGIEGSGPLSRTWSPVRSQALLIGPVMSGSGSEMGAARRARCCQTR